MAGVLIINIGITSTSIVAIKITKCHVRKKDADAEVDKEYFGYRLLQRLWPNNTIYIILLMR